MGIKKLGLIFILFSFSALAETEFKIITLQHRFAADLLPIIQPMVGEDGTATGIDNQLILRASAVRMLQIEQTITQLDIARINRKITVRTSHDTQSQQDLTEANANVRIGRATINNNRRVPPNSGRIDIERNSSNISQNSQQFIQVIDGERAFIRVGQIVPLTQEWVTITQRYVQIDRITDWREISTGFAVRPHTIGNQIELEITPRIARLNHQGFIDFEELTTILRVSLGDWLDIGGVMLANDEVSRKILGLQRASGQYRSNLMVKVD
ncbi:MAG: secretin N-terminal domain-containing protein [Methylophilaceae bacterium]